MEGGDGEEQTAEVKTFLITQVSRYSGSLDSKKKILTTFQTSSVFQKLAASSTLNRVPPIGAPNAADTPEAAPAATRSRMLWSFRNSP